MAPPPHTPTTFISHDALLGLCNAALTAAGAHGDTAHSASLALIAAHVSGKYAHGLTRLSSLCDSLRSGEASDTPAKIRRVSPALVRIDAMENLIFPAYDHAATHLAEMASSSGLAAAAVINARGVFGPLWYAAERVVKESNNKCAALVLCNSAAFVAPENGGTKRIFGTNPFCFAWPRPDGKLPMVVDFATAASSRGEIVKRASNGTPIPSEWAVDANGMPTTDASKALEGAQLCFGGHKGQCLSLVVELMGSCLLGTALGMDASDADQQKEAGHMKRGLLIVAFDIDKCAENGHAQALADAERLFDAMPRVPGDARTHARAKAEENDGMISIDANLLAKIKELTKADEDDADVPAAKRARQ